MGRRNAKRDHFEDAMSHLVGLDSLCKLLLLRVGQIQMRCPSLNGLITPMEGEIIEIMTGIRNAQAAHERIWQEQFMT